MMQGADLEAMDQMMRQMGRGMMLMGRGMVQMGDGMMTGARMMQGGGMMGSGITQGDMMRGGEMMGSPAMQGGGSGMGLLFGSRVTPMMNLSVEDVRGYLSLRLERLNNKRLKIGELKSDDRIITADIVTLDNSLVQQLKIDRRTGIIVYVN